MDLGTGMGQGGLKSREACKGLEEWGWNNQQVGSIAETCMALSAAIDDHDHQLEHVHGWGDSYFKPVHHGMGCPLEVSVD